MNPIAAAAHAPSAMTGGTGLRSREPKATAVVTPVQTTAQALSRKVARTASAAARP